ncbi:MAG: helix-turn-helix domain-containing protein [Alphaproteobacteria bacterium]|nr:helix-turn-helix domain-containing protein [Alphaproteobacteria bacterium]
MTFITKKELADKLNVSTRTLDRWHARRIGPARTQIGNFIAYRINAVEDWLKKNEVHPVNTKGGQS